VGEACKHASIKDAAAAINLYKHPQGSPKQTPDDKPLKRNLIEAGNLLDIQILDPIVIGNGGFVSR